MTQQQSRRFSLTRRSVEALPAHDPTARSREAEYSDAGCVGLHLRVSKGGRRFYQFRYTYHGRKRCIALGEHTERFGVQEARTMVAEFKAMVGKDLDPAEERGKQRTDLTFSEFAEQQYIPMAKERKKSWASDAYWIRKRIVPELGTRPLKSITARDVAQMHGKELHRTSATSANHLLACMKTVLSAAVRLGFVDRNVALGQKKYAEPPPRDRYLSKEELPRFMKALEEAGGRLAVSAITLLVLTGMRRTECLSLRWDQVYLDEKRIALRITKSKRPRSVHLNSKALEVIREIAARRGEDAMTRESEYLFPSRAPSEATTARGYSHKPYLYDVRKPFQRACKAAGIEGARLHDLRRTFGSWGVMSGASIYSVQKLLGHRDVGVTESTYAHLSGDALLAASEGVATMLDLATAAGEEKAPQEAAG